MAQAIARGLLVSGTVARDRIFASDTSEKARNDMKDLGVQATKHNGEVVQEADVVLVAVKPNIVPGVLREVAPTVTSKKLLVSVAAGVTLEAMEKCLPHDSRVIRVMPNTPSLVRQGASAYALGMNAGPRDGEIVRHLMSAVGHVEEVEESQLSAVAGVSGSGPAYCFVIMEAMADGGVKNGLPREVALKLAGHTLMGAARLVLESSKHPGELKDNVCTPEGSTIYGINHLERAGLRGIMMGAIDASMQRAAELSNQSSSSDQSLHRDTELHKQANGNDHFDKRETEPYHQTYSSYGY